MIPPLPDRVACAVAAAEKTLKVKEIAERCGVIVQTVYDWRKKKTMNLKGETLVELAEVSGMSARYIINGKGPMTLDLSRDEMLIIDAFRLRGEEMRKDMVSSAQRLLEERRSDKKSAA